MFTLVLVFFGLLTEEGSILDPSKILRGRKPNSAICSVMQLGATALGLLVYKHSTSNQCCSYTQGFAACKVAKGGLKAPSIHL